MLDRPTPNESVRDTLPIKSMNHCDPSIQPISIVPKPAYVETSVRNLAVAFGLSVVHATVLSVQPDKLFVASIFNYATILDHTDKVGHSNR